MRYSLRFFSQHLNTIVENLPLKIFILIIIAVLAYHKIFTFWFFHGWEASWLIGLTGGDFSIVNLMKSHGFISYFNYVLFGWNPKGWYFTGLVLHIFASIGFMLFTTMIIKNKMIGFFAALLFIATTAHHDVITWGSFESLYAAQTLLFYISLILFYKFRKTSHIKYYLAFLTVFVTSLLLRESGIILVPILVIFDMIFIEKQSIKNIQFQVIKKILLIHLPIWIAAGMYLWIRGSYGGSAHDFIDERVQFRILLFNEQRYLEYIWYGLVAFGQYIPPIFVPYPFLNFLRDLLFQYFPNEIIRNYFFSSLGWSLYLGIIWIIILQRRSKYFSYILFLFLMYTIIMFFYSFAWTLKPSFLPIPYSWSENRWRYFSFTALSPIIIISLFALVNFLHNKTKFFNVKNFVAFCVLVHIVINLFLLNKIQEQMYEQNHYPAIRFYETLKNEIPNLSERQRIYQFRGSPGLNDFLAELYYIRDSFYPEISKIPSDWIRSDLYYPLKYLSDNTFQRDDFVFIDYSVEEGVVNKSENVYKYLDSQKLSIFEGESIVENDNTFVIDVGSVHPVDFRYKLKMTYFALGQEMADPSYQPTKETFIQNLAFSYKKMEAASVDVCKTMGQEKEPFYDFRPDYLIDGNLGKRSIWWADCRPAWVVIDMGQRQDVAGFVWSSLNSLESFPRNYTYSVSNDGKNWRTVFSRTGNEIGSRIDILSKVESTRYVRFHVEETSYRQMLVLNEFVPFISSTVVESPYSDAKELYDDYYKNITSLPAGDIETSYPSRDLSWVRVSWETEPSNNVPVEDLSYYVPIYLGGTEESVTFELPESEYYSNSGQFINRFLKKVYITPPKNVKMSLNSVTLSPLFLE